MAIDQAHEQKNALVKGDGGAVGLTENPAALWRCMVSGPEMDRVIAEFQATSETKKADPAVINIAREIEKLGQEQHDSYVHERLVNQTKPITDPIKRNNILLFSRPPVRDKSRTQLQVSSLKNDCSLFSRLFIASQIRDGDLDEFFAPSKCMEWYEFWC